MMVHASVEASVAAETAVSNEERWPETRAAVAVEMLKSKSVLRNNRELSEGIGALKGSEAAQSSCVPDFSALDASVRLKQPDPVIVN